MGHISRTLAKHHALRQTLDIFLSQLGRMAELTRRSAAHQDHINLNLAKHSAFKQTQDISQTKVVHLTKFLA